MARKKRKWKLGASLLCVLGAAACATPEEQAAARERQMHVDYTTCVEDYGFRPNSDGARNCMLQLDIAREQQQNYSYHGSYWDRHPRFGSGIYFMNR
jgi:hypothetical protein